MITKVDFDVLIKRPVEEVWNYWFDMDNVPTWAHNVKEIRQITEGPRDVGARFVWMQLDVINEPAAEKVRAAGLEIVMDHCPAIEYPRLMGGSPEH